MDDITTIGSLKDIIFDQYPVSFIIIVLSALGFYMGHLVFKAQRVYLEKTVDSLIQKLLERLM